LSVKIDLHTHSYGSPDGGLTVKDFSLMLENGPLDWIAITDHGQIAAAQQIKAELGKLGERIIIGEEIKTTDGEIIGLYLMKEIAEGLTPIETVAAIRAQNGLVYIPHPFETQRSGISAKALVEIIDDVNIIETCNGRAVFQNKGKIAQDWAERHNKATAASSDVHGWHGWGRTYSILSSDFSKETLANLLGAATFKQNKVGVRGLLYPKFHRLRRMLNARNR